MKVLGSDFEKIWIRLLGLVCNGLGLGYTECEFDCEFLRGQGCDGICIGL